MSTSMATTSFSLILVVFFPTCLGVYEHIKNKPRTSDGVVSFPTFAMSEEMRNVTAFVGQSALLHCIITDIGDQRVSWIRKSDLHVLTSGLLTFTTDQRFSAHHSPEESNVWTLQIKFAQLRDSGAYQCQVNSEPKISTTVFLTVTEAKARIASPANKEVHVRKRSRVTLTCAVELGQAHQSSAVFWYLDGEALDWLGQTGRGRGVRVNTQKKDGELVSTLVIDNAALRHAGKFTCAPSYANSDSVTLHVVDGESRAELQGNGAVSAQPRSYFIVASSAVLSLVVLIKRTR